MTKIPLNYEQRRNATDRAKSPVNPQVPGSSPGRGATELVVESIT